MWIPPWHCDLFAAVIWCTSPQPFGTELRFSWSHGMVLSIQRFHVFCSWSFIHLSCPLGTWHHEHRWELTWPAASQWISFKIWWFQWGYPDSSSISRWDFPLQTNHHWVPGTSIDGTPIFQANRWSHNKARAFAVWHIRSCDVASILRAAHFPGLRAGDKLTAGVAGITGKATPFTEAQSETYQEVKLVNPASCKRSSTRSRFPPAIPKQQVYGVYSPQSKLCQPQQLLGCTQQHWQLP